MNTTQERAEVALDAQQPRPSFYAELIRMELATLGLDEAKYPPAEVEAWMRIEHPTLDGLAPWQFREEVAVACQCIAAASPEESRALAVSFGLIREASRAS